MSSLSSHAMSTITVFRNPNNRREDGTYPTQGNPNPLNVVLAEPAYLCMIPFAIVETAISLIAKIFTFLLPIGQNHQKAMSRWVISSAFSIGWSICDAIINIFCRIMVVNEESARGLAQSDNIWAMPESEMPIRIPTEVRARLQEHARDYLRSQET